MVGTVHTDSDDEPRVVRPVRKVKPTAALLEHSEKAALPSQTKAINAFRAAEAAKHATNDTHHPPAAKPQQAPTLSAPAPSPEPTPPEAANKRAHVEDIDEDISSGDEKRENARINPKCESICKRI
jgi:hypothetical protein